MIECNNNILSSFTPLVSFKYEVNKFINDNFILPKVINFFEMNDIKQYESINFGASICDLDFNEREFSYFYDKLLYDIRKTPNGKITFKVKYLISFDKKLCQKLCASTNLYYEYISIGKSPLLYFIYIDFNEMMDFLRKNKFNL